MSVLLCFHSFMLCHTVAFIITIIGDTKQEKDIDTAMSLDNNKKVYRWFGPDSERRTTYAAAVTESDKRKVDIVVGDSLDRKSETRQNN